MKTHPNNAIIALIALATILIGGRVVRAQDPYTGKWAGKFMGDFPTAILLEALDGSSYKGKILMYSGEMRIQDDELSEISIENGTLTFYIADKETTFKGSFNEEISELSGKFIFPDKSEHLLLVRKTTEDDSADTQPKPSPIKKIREKIPAEELKSDLKYLLNKLREYHPRLYSYTSEDAFNEKASRVYSVLTRDMSLEEYFLQIAPFLAEIKCSHTGIRLPAEYQELLYHQTNYLPLDVFIQGNKIYALSVSGYKNPGLIPGEEILSINQRPARQIIEELLSIIPSEGNNQTGKYQELNRHFQRYFHLLDRSKSFEVVYGSGSDPKKTVLEGLNYMEARAESKQEEILPVRFQMDRGAEMALLKVGSFGIRDMEDYFNLLDSAFLCMETEGIPNLVLDLRDNKGGHPIFAAQLLSYLTKGEFTYFQRNEEVKDFEPLYNPMQANKQHFKGNLYVLVNGSCLSTAGHLISLIKYHTEAKFIGEEPGSTFICNDMSSQIKLPHSGLEVNIPRTTFVTAVQGFQTGIPFRVDYQLNITVQDLIQDNDVYFEYFKSLITEK